MASRKEMQMKKEEEMIEWDLTEFAIEESMVQRRSVVQVVWRSDVC